MGDALSAGEFAGGAGNSKSRGIGVMDRPSHCLSAVCNGASLRGLFMPLADSPGLRISPLLHLSPQRAHLPHVPPESNTMQYNTSHSPQKFPHKKIPPNQPQASQTVFLTSHASSHPVTQTYKPANLTLSVCKPYPTTPSQN